MEVYADVLVVAQIPFKWSGTDETETASLQVIKANMQKLEQKHLLEQIFQKFWSFQEKY